MSDEKPIRVGQYKVTTTTGGATLVLRTSSGKEIAEVSLGDGIIHSLLFDLQRAAIGYAIDRDVTPSE